MAKICGAKTRKGTPCEKPPMLGKRRCKLHGGASTGPKGKCALETHGIYSKRLSDEERALLDEMRLGSLDDEIRVARLTLCRILREWRKWLDADGYEDEKDLLHLVEVRQELATIDAAPPAAAPDQPESAEAATAERSPLYRRTFVGREQELDG